MKVPNYDAFPGLTVDNPVLQWGYLNPTTDYANPLLINLPVGSLYISLIMSGGICPQITNTCLMQKIQNTTDANCAVVGAFDDWLCITPTTYPINTFPDKRRPWVKEGVGQASNYVDVLETDNIWHTGTVVRGATSIQSTNADMENIDNFANGAGTNSFGFNAHNNFINGQANQIKATNNLGGYYGGLDIVNGNANTIDDTLTSFVNGTGNQILASAVQTQDALISGSQNVVHGGVAGIIVLGSTIDIPAGNLHSFTAASFGTPFTSLGSYTFSARYHQGFHLRTNDLSTTGVDLNSSSSSWVSVSDAQLKEVCARHFDRDAVLSGYKALNVVTYTMLGDQAQQTMLGVTAQNFYESFGDFVNVHTMKGSDLLGISQTERDSVQDLGIQALLARIEVLEAMVARLTTTI